MTLEQIDRNTEPLSRMLGKVKSGDPYNIEAQAARYYWTALFGRDFRRDIDAGGLNARLNYGYAIIRALISRAIVCGGLNPSLGVKHTNQYNHYCLADDLMEPLRPWVDLRVFRLATEGSSAQIDKAFKYEILTILGCSVHWNERLMPLMVACQYYIASLRDIFEGKGTDLLFPVRA